MCTRHGVNCLWCRMVLDQHHLILLVNVLLEGPSLLACLVTYGQSHAAALKCCL